MPGSNGVSAARGWGPPDRQKNLLVGEPRDLVEGIPVGVDKADVSPHSSGELWHSREKRPARRLQPLGLTLERPPAHDLLPPGGGEPSSWPGGNGRHVGRSGRRHRPSGWADQTPRPQVSEEGGSTGQMVVRVHHSCPSLVAHLPQTQQLNLRCWNGRVTPAAASFGEPGGR